MHLEPPSPPLLVLTASALVQLCDQDLLAEVFNSDNDFDATIEAMTNCKPPKLKFSDGMSCLVQIYDSCLVDFGEPITVCRVILHSRCCLIPFDLTCELVD